MKLETLLKDLYDSEINISISWLWDAGVDVKLGDEMNGFIDEKQVPVTEITRTLFAMVMKHYPTSTFGQKYMKRWVEMKNNENGM